MAKKARPANPDNPWRDALLRAVMGKDDNLQWLANRLVARAMKGDMAALRELGDRLDGKPAQAITSEVTTMCGKTVDAPPQETREQWLRRVHGKYFHA